MVDASAMGTVCMKIKHRRDMELLFDALGGESGMELIKDVTIGDTENMDLIDAGKSWAMVNKKVVTSLEEGKDELRQAHGLIADNGRFQRTVNIAFFNMSAVSSSVGDLAGKIKTQDEDKKRRAAEAEAAEQARLEAEQDAKDIGGKLSYYPTKGDWEHVESAAVDTRTSDPRIVAGGAPPCLNTTEELTLKRDKTRPTWRPITKYAIGEPNKRGDFKVYIEDPGVIVAEASAISVDFKTKSYTVRVKTDAEPLVLGPVEPGGQLDLQASSWKLSPGKRLTISCVKARNDARNRSQEQQVADAMAKSEKKDKAEDEPSSMSSLWGTVVSLLPVLLGLLYMFYMKQS